MSNSERTSTPTVWEVTLGALLHDIGKLAQRAADGKALPDNILNRQEDVLPARDGRQSHWHALWSDFFFDWVEKEKRLRWPKGIDLGWARDLAVFHHNPLQAYERQPRLATTWLVTIADRAASGFERKARDEEKEASEHGRNAFRRTPMDAIASRIKLDDRDAPQGGKHLPCEWSADALIPIADCSGEEVEQGYRQLWDAFTAEWEKITKRCCNDPAAFEEVALNVMERFTWAVPSSTIDQPDVSLYDHSRTVAAFAAALHAHHEDREELEDVTAIKDYSRPRLRFLVGDLSGLQKTLFRLANEQVKGLNRILRGRSLRFQMIMELATRRALRAFTMPMSAALQMAGGRFLLLLPDLGEDKMRPRVDKLRVDFDKWLAAQYFGDLGIGLALSDPFATADLSPLPKEKRDRTESIKRADEVRKRLQIAVEEAKLRQLQGPAAQALFRVDYPHGVCSACGLRPAGEPENEAPLRCAACAAEHDLGQHFPKARAVVLRLPEAGDEGGPGDAILGGRCLLPRGEGQERHDCGLGWRFSANDHGPAPIRANKAYVPLFKEGDRDKKQYKSLEDLDEIKPDNIKTFAALAADSCEMVNDKLCGRPMLAVLKADVDRLGMIFNHGLGDEWSLARTAALSRMLDGYFTIRLPKLLEQDFPNTYTVYAGGDDLLLVAPWREAFDLAGKLREDFGRFSLNNPSLTFSAGLALFDSCSPISIAVGEADERLEKAKKDERNRISAIEADPMTWDDFSTALAEAEKLNGWLREEKLSTSGLYRLLALDDARQHIARGKAHPADYAWKARFGYHLARMLRRRKEDSYEQEIYETLVHLFGLDVRFADTTPKPGARLAITHALYRNR